MEERVPDISKYIDFLKSRTTIELASMIELAKLGRSQKMTSQEFEVAKELSELFETEDNTYIAAIEQAKTYFGINIPVIPKTEQTSWWQRFIACLKL